MKPCKILYDKAREFNREAEALRARAAALDAKADTLKAAAREIDPWYVVEVMCADGKPKTFMRDEIGVSLNSGCPPLTVKSVKGDKVKVSWIAEDGTQRVAMIGSHCLREA